MKKIVLHNCLLTALIIALLFPACGKQLNNSCNPELEEWVITNAPYFKSATVTDYLQLPLDKQRALFPLLSAEKKLALWKRRMIKEQESSLLVGRELEEYLSFLSKLTAFDFSRTGEKQALKKSKAFLNKMREQYAWDEYKEFFYLHTWLTEEEYSEALMLQIQQSLVLSKTQMSKEDKAAYIEVLGVIDSSAVDTVEVQDDTLSVNRDCECIYDVGCGIGTMRTCDKRIPCTPVQRCGIIPNNSNCTGICS